MTKKEPLVIYWAPVFDQDTNPQDWNLLYAEPTTVFDDLVPNKEKLSKRGSSFNCPAVSDRMHTSFVFRNNLTTTFSYDFSNLENPTVLTENGIYSQFYKMPNMVGGGYVQVALQWVFFCEESVIAITNPPFLHQPTEYSTKALFPAGRYDISKWFRPVSMELQTWDQKNTITINENDPLFYLEVLTERPIHLQRFSMNKQLQRYMAECVSNPSVMGYNLPLSDRYRRFLNTGTNRLVLKEIKNNLV